MQMIQSCLMKINKVLKVLDEFDKVCVRRKLEMNTGNAKKKSLKKSVQKVVQKLNEKQGKGHI